MLRTPFAPQKLEGREFRGTRELPTLRAIYQIGDFRYQVLAPNGWRSKIKTCTRHDTVEYLEQQLYKGNTVVAEVPTKKPARA